MSTFWKILIPLCIARLNSFTDYVFEQAAALSSASYVSMETVEDESFAQSRASATQGSAQRSRPPPSARGGPAGGTAGSRHGRPGAGSFANPFTFDDSSDDGNRAIM